MTAPFVGNRSVQQVADTSETAIMDCDGGRYSSASDRR
jgi:hypothetical protein